MRSFCKLFLVLIFLMTFAIVPASAQDTETTGQVFDLGDVLIMDKGDETNPITSTNVVSIDDMQKQGAKSAADALEMIPGLDIQLGGKGQANLKLRGFDQRDVKVLIDGVPAHESYSGSLDLDQIPIDTIAKIKVIKGASSVLYGPNTMGGVVNIITKKGSEKPVTSITASFGKNSTQNFVVNHGATVGKFNYWITASQRKTDGFDVSDNFKSNNPRTGLGTDYNEDGGVRDLSYFTKNTLNTKFGYEYDANSKIYLSFDYHQNEKGCPTENSRYWEFTEWNQWQLSLAGEHDFTDIFSVRARVYYVDHDDTLEDVSWDAAHSTSRKWFEQSAYDDYTVGGEVQGYFDFGDKSLLKLGVSYMKDNHKQQDLYDATTRSVLLFGDSVGYQPSEEYEIDVYSFGIEDDIKLSDKLMVTAGFSYDVHEPVKAFGNIDRDTEKTFNPQAGVSYDATKDLNLYASVGKKTRFPQMQELYSTLAGGNSSLKPQQTVAYEIGAKKQFGSSFDVSVAVFLNDIEDRIVNPNRTGNVNLAETRSRGLETQINYLTSWDLDIGFGYTYLSSKDKDDSTSPEKRSEFIPKHKATVDLRYAFDFGLSASFQYIYTGTQIEYDNANNPVRLDEFVVCNARLNQELPLFDKVGTDIFLELNNMFDENYDEGSGPTAGRNFLLGMTVRF